jgi:phosphoribosylformimino-5-aminoimidazole carboxamide ribonucleotide (ProFAR) isomerase
MRVIPSIDVEGGRAVKRVRGVPGTGLADLGDPRALLDRFGHAGADRVHVVDLDAAEGRGSNRSLLLGLPRADRPRLQVGGGWRAEEELDRAFAAGVDRVLLSTAAWEDGADAERPFRRFGDRVGLSLDVAEGRLWTRGWRAPGPSLSDALARLRSLNVRWIVLTEIAGEGAKHGFPLERLAQVRRAFGGELLVAGGVADRAELVRLANEGADGVVLGRALYDGSLPESVLGEEFG